jgi:hypothetical protein
MGLAYGDGIDVDGADDLWATKATLVERHCDEAREHVIQTLGAGQFRNDACRQGFKSAY